MKAIIIAAGIGARLKPFTDDQPKCMLELGGKPLIEHQTDILRSLGISDISIIKGYRQEKIDFSDSNFNYYLNENYRKNNILESLFCAEPEIRGEVVILYSDIIFKMEVVKKLLESKEKISIVVDVNWKTNYVDRRDHPIEEAESVIFDDKGCVRKIGKILDVDKSLVSGEFIGMLKLCGEGADTLKRFYHESRKKYQGGPFQKAVTFSQAYLTDIIQELVDNSVEVSCVKICNGWKEIDTVEDYKNAAEFYKNTGL
jgi:L-glutamine-phosphate cytidylyltransferase